MGSKALPWNQLHTASKPLIPQKSETKFVYENTASKPLILQKPGFFGL